MFVFVPLCKKYYHEIYICQQEIIPNRIFYYHRLGLQKTILFGMIFNMVVKEMEMTLGERIRKARRGRGKMTQAELAERIGVHEMTVRRWESGERMPDAEAIQKISQVLGVPISELLTETAEVSSSESKESRNELPGLAYWGGVADNARNVALRGDSEYIADVSQLLRRALASLGRTAAAV